MNFLGERKMKNDLTKIFYSIAQKYTNNKEQQNDLVQDAFLAVFEKESEYDSERSSYITWAYWIAKGAMKQSRNHENLIKRTESKYGFSACSDFQHNFSQTALEVRMTSRQNEIVGCWSNGEHDIDLVNSGFSRSEVRNTRKKAKKLLGWLMI